MKFFSETFRELEEEKLKGATIDIGKLYETFVDQTLARDGLQARHPAEREEVLLAELALHFHVEGLNEIANADLDDWLTREIEAEPALRKLQWGAGAEDALTRFELFLQDLRNATLLVRPGEKEFRFGHTSVREFFLAEALHRRIREGRLDALGGRGSHRRDDRFPRRATAQRRVGTGRAALSRAISSAHGAGPRQGIALVRREGRLARRRRFALAGNRRFFRLRSYEFRVRGARP